MSFISRLFPSIKAIWWGDDDGRGEGHLRELHRETLDDPHARKVLAGCAPVFPTHSYIVIKDGRPVERRPAAMTTVREWMEAIGATEVRQRDEFRPMGF